MQIPQLIDNGDYKTDLATNLQNLKGLMCVCVCVCVCVYLFFYFALSVNKQNKFAKNKANKKQNVCDSFVQKDCHITQLSFCQKKNRKKKSNEQTQIDESLIKGNKSFKNFYEMFNEISWNTSFVEYNNITAMCTKANYITQGWHFLMDDAKQIDWKQLNNSKPIVTYYLFEKTPHYYKLPHIANILPKHFPKTKIIILLREPVQRVM